MKKNYSITEGRIFPSLVHFAIPVLLAIFLQSLYGAVDLLVVGRFSTTSDVSGVSTGGQLMHTITNVISALAMGVTVIVGRAIGEKRPEEAGKAIGSGIVLFGLIALGVTIVMVPFSPGIARLMQTPEEAFSETVSYLRICSSGLLFIVAYNLIGSIFRGIGDSTTPLVTVSISCVLNIFADILFVAVFDMGASGAALATVISQAVSVITSLLIIRKKDIPVEFNRKCISFDGPRMKSEIKIGIPVSISSLLVGISFLVIQAVVNHKGLVASAAIGVGQKVISFIMLVPDSFAQSMTAFVAQNLGAQRPDRAGKALKCGILTSLCFGAVMCYITLFHGNVLASIFNSNADVIAASHSYLKAYAIDCMLTPFLFCMVGYFNGWGKTTFVMFQGVLSAFLVRAPLAFLFSSISGSTMFLIGLSTPCATFVQIIMCIWMFRHMSKKS